MFFTDNFGDILSEAPVLLFTIWFAVRWVQLRRKLKHQPVYTETDRRAFRGSAEYSPLDLQFYPRFALAVFAVATTGVLEFITLAPFGAAILTGAFLFSSAVIVQRLLF